MSNITSDKQAAANRANSALSTGPRTAAGKAASSQNAISHGLSSASVTIFSWESKEKYEKMRAAYIARYCPIDQPELDLVERLLDSTWRHQRVVTIETTLLDLGISEMNQEIIDKYDNADDDQLRIALSFCKRHGEGVWDALNRYLTAADRGYQRAQRELRILQGDRFNKLPLDYSEIVERLQASAAQPQPQQPEQAEPQPQEPDPPPETAPETTPTTAKIIEFAERSHSNASTTHPAASRTTTEQENDRNDEQSDPNLAA